MFFITSPEELLPSHPHHAPKQMHAFSSMLATLKLNPSRLQTTSSHTIHPGTLNKTFYCSQAALKTRGNFLLATTLALTHTLPTFKTFLSRYHLCAITPSPPSPPPHYHHLCTITPSAPSPCLHHSCIYATLLTQ